MIIKKLEFQIFIRFEYLMPIHELLCSKALWCNRMENLKRVKYLLMIITQRSFCFGQLPLHRLQLPCWNSESLPFENRSTEKEAISPSFMHNDEQKVKRFQIIKLWGIKFQFFFSFDINNDNVYNHI